MGFAGRAARRRAGAAASRSRGGHALGGPPRALLAGPRDRADERAAGRLDERDRAAAGRRAAVPRLLGLPGGGGLPGAARARPARRAARHAQPGLRDRDPGRAGGGCGVLGGLRPPAPSPARAVVIRRARLLRGGLVAVMVVWGVASLASVAPLDDPTPVERATGALIVPAVGATLLYAIAGWRYLTMALRTGSPILLAGGSAGGAPVGAVAALGVARRLAAGR